MVLPIHQSSPEDRESSETFWKWHEIFYSLRLRVARKDGARSLFNGDLLLSAIPTSLTLTIAPPFDTLHLSTADVRTYSDINSYLLAIRRGHIRLTELWKQSQLRRDYPTPLGPLGAAPLRGAAVLKVRRERSSKRDHHMRKIWATSSAADLSSERGVQLF